jgi:hypothetical protein
LVCIKEQVRQIVGVLVGVIQIGQQAEEDQEQAIIVITGQNNVQTGWAWADRV